MTAQLPTDRHRRSGSATNSHGDRRHIAVVGAGMAGVACARTLLQAGHRVTLIEREATPGGRMASERTPFGRFDSGAQYFTVRDPRFAKALETAPTMCKRWSANAVRVLDAFGRTVEAALPTHEPHWVALPGMDSLVAHWAAPLTTFADAALVTNCGVTRIERDALAPTRLQLQTESVEGANLTHHVHSGFDAVMLAVPAGAARRLLERADGSQKLLDAMAGVRIAPCWTLMIAFPQAAQPGLAHLGPQWNAARSTHHRVAWLARESSKPGRDTIERWTLQASAAWSEEHRRDDPARIEGKLLRAFAEITGVHAQPSHVQSRFWSEAKTEIPLGQPHLWDAKARIGVAGDWCMGHRVEDAFLSGLSLALDSI